jgi:predicted transcriptional regulator
MITMPRRSRLSVLFLTLSCILKNPGIRATHLMYKANISYAQLQLYTGLLSSLDLIQVQKEEKALSYNITEKGKEVLKLLGDLEKVLYGEETAKIGQIL